ncbi:hypothetical protein [Paraburkholderia ginsengisoli]|uniref:Uncharacterized protein n=1 Tax=Paraburkholderia ginsengisoli TaxID=311231 RepID=A0A7T4N0U8_9BURK|nr:hypothetical protein [Paraburkholderia ginsengisoli]QQC63161.1 hypothetical protein I6I06_12690 [Paraburkholderia ginsengisoli]
MNLSDEHMPAKLEHDLAYYFDKQGVRQEIRAEDLSDVTTRALAAEQNLTDKSGQTELSPRVRNGAVPHFVATGVRGTRNIFEGETDDTHNARVRALLQRLKGARKWQLALGESVAKSTGGFDWKLHDAIELTAYEWGNEVYRIVTKDAIIRHDLFGQALRLDMSANEPWVAIEVIHTHFPEEEAFGAMLDLSERVPFYVLFDFTALRDKFLRVLPESNAIIYREWTYLIHDGQVWKGTKKQDIRTSAALKVHVLDMFRRWDVKF